MCKGQVLRAAFKIDARDRVNLDDLIDRAFKYKADFINISRSQIDKFRKLRNNITHYGFSPLDDNKSIEALFFVGLELFSDCMYTFFAIPLYPKEIDGKNQGVLLHEICNHLRVAKSVLIKVRSLLGIDHSYCLSALQAYINYSIRQNTLPQWQSSLLSDYVSGQDAKDEIKKYIIHEFRHEYNSTYNYSYPCKVCIDYDNSFIAALDDDALFKEGSAKIKVGYCLNCGFKVPESYRFLADELYADYQQEVINYFFEPEGHS